MSINVYYVYKWSKDLNDVKSFESETKCFYVDKKGRKEKKETSWYWTYKKETDALAHIARIVKREYYEKEGRAMRDAAPDMYKALEDLVTAWHSRDDGFRMNSFDTALDALKKARGEL